LSKTEKVLLFGVTCAPNRVYRV